MLDRIVEFFMPKVGELLVDHLHDNIKEFIFTFHSLGGNLATLSAKASDIDNEIQNGEIPGKRKRKREVEEWLVAVKSIETEFFELEHDVESQGFISRFLGEGRAAQLNERVDGLIQQSRHFGELMLDVCETMGEALLTTRLIGNTFEENLGKIWRLLSSEKVSSLGIHGMGGVGKTTLAKHINNRLLEQSKERVIWVTVSQASAIWKLQDEIARFIRVDLLDDENEDKRAMRLYRALSRRKNVLILDDVLENINLEKVGYPLSEDGFRLIITTRSVEVCRRFGVKEVVVVKTLPKDEAWKLFSEKLGNETRLTPQVEEIAKRIAETCDGLPLGIIVLAGSMRSETAIHIWRNALEELKEYSVMGRDDMEDEIFKVLKCSFDRLNPNKRRQRQSSNVEQLCFLYCSLYPEDYKISKEELVGKFISEGLMDEKKRRRQQADKAHCILDKLVNVCLLESCTDGEVKMHDIVRSMALKITEGTTMAIAGHRSLKEIPNEEEWTKDLVKVSLMRNGIKEIPSGMSPYCPKLSTLIFCDNPLECLPDSFFSQMLGLCTLDLSKTKIEKLPNSLSALERLTVLLLHSCYRLVYIPYMGNLKALRELDLSGTAITELPRGIEELVNIKCLSMDAENMEMFSSGLLLRFQNLQCLKLPNHLEVPAGEIEKLKQLEVFSGRVKNACDVNGFIRSRAYETVYNINIGHSIEGRSMAYWPGHFNRRVSFIKYNLKNGQEPVLGRDIEGVSISHCEGLTRILLDDFRRLIDNPKYLRCLQVIQCGGTECILVKESLLESQPPVFSTLESIWLQRLGDFKGIIITEEREIVAPAPSRQAVFSSLRFLLISECPKIKKLGLPASEFPILEELSVSGCSETEEIVEVGEGEARCVSLPKLRKLELLDLPNLKKLGLPVSGFPNLEEVCVSGSSEMEEIFQEIGGGGRLVSFLPKLRKLNLINLPSLKSVCNKGRVICGSIKIIHLISCLSLKKLSLEVVPPPPSLTESGYGNKSGHQWSGRIPPILSSSNHSSDLHNTPFVP